jgi:hypothetical protein
MKKVSTPSVLMFPLPRSWNAHQNATQKSFQFNSTFYKAHCVVLINFFSIIKITRSSCNVHTRELLLFNCETIIDFFPLQFNYFNTFPFALPVCSFGITKYFFYAVPFHIKLNWVRFLSNLLLQRMHFCRRSEKKIQLKIIHETSVQFFWKCNLVRWSMKILNWHALQFRITNLTF